jgi:hypothetical protein
MRCPREIGNGTSALCLPGVMEFLELVVASRTRPDTATCAILRSVSMRSSPTWWIAAACRQAVACVLTTILIAPVAAAQATYRLSIDLAHVGYRGTAQITSSPAGIACRREPSPLPGVGTCAADFAAGTLVTLSVTALNDGTFDGWNGACSGTGTCQVTMSQNRTVGANIVAKLYSLTVQGISSANGGGRLTRADFMGSPGIDCVVSAGGVTTQTCVSQYPANQTAQIFRETPSVAVSRFLGFSGACTGDGFSCDVVMDGNETITVGWMAMEVRISSAGGSGTGTVTGTAPNHPIGSFDCTIAPSTGATGTCSAKYDIIVPPASITLTATPTGNSVFAGWSGKCSGTGPCVIQSEIDLLSVSANFTAAPAQTFRLRVSQTLGDQSLGTAQITSSPAGIDCTSEPWTVGNTGTCAFDFPAGTVVTVTATPLHGGTFDQWIGACAGSGPCQIAMTENRDIDAVVTARTFKLKVVFAGNGGGKVYRSDLLGRPAIDCRITTDGVITPGSVCESEYPANQKAFLLHETTSISTARWAGFTECPSKDNCGLVMDGAKTVTAAWIAMQVTIGSGGGNGSGTVTGGPQAANAPFNCAITPAGASGVCSVKWETTSFNSVTLTATPAPGSVFAGWSGKCTGTSPTCVIPWEQNPLPVSANFVAATQTTFKLRVTNNIENSRGTARVVSSPAGIDCVSEPSPLQSSGTCQADFNEGTVVALTATALHGGTFDGWAGACTGTGACQVTMTADRSVQTPAGISVEATISVHPG